MKKSPIDDLEYLAQLGYEKVATDNNDLSELKKRVRVRTFSYNSGLYFGAISLISGVFIGITVFFAISEEVPYKSSYSHKPSLRKEPAVDTAIVPAERMVETEEEKFTKEKASVNGSVPEVPVIEPAGDFEELERWPVTPGILEGRNLTEEKLKFIINSPIFYIHDLKVTDYTTLYFRKQHFIRTSGLPAAYSEKSHEERPGINEAFLHEELADALLLFKKQRYAECIEALKQVAAFNDVDLNCTFYTAMSFYHLKAFERSVPLFKICTETLNNAFFEEAQYYMALALCQGKDQQEGELLLKKIVAQGGFYAVKAAEQLRTQQQKAP